MSAHAASGKVCHVTDRLPFIDLQAQRRRLGPKIDQAIQRVLAHGQFIMGPEVAQLERQLGAYCGSQHVITCSSGTDALSLVLMAKGVTRGDAVFCPAFTFCATAEVVAALGATPVLVDVDAATFNIGADSLRDGIAVAVRSGLRPIGIIPVDLFGLPADYDSILGIAHAFGLWVLADAAQSFGARIGSRRVGSLAPVTANSFFPSKPLGCYGDGGAVFTDDDELAEEIRLRRIHGQSPDRTDSLRIGMTGRLDTIQAAVLLEKLSVFDDELDRRSVIAARYTEALGPYCIAPLPDAGHRSAWAQYTIRVPAELRDRLATHLTEKGVPTAIYYARPVHRQSAYADCPTPNGGLPVCDRLAGEVLSLPMHAYLSPDQQDKIVAAVLDVLDRQSQ
jgi:dTDP-4-amino-4,6-dideoxygalactose transaminase